MNLRKPKLDANTMGAVSSQKKEKKKGKSKISKRLSKFKKDNVCKGKSGDAKLKCQYKNGMITGDAYIRKLRRAKGKKFEKVNTRTYSFKSND